MTTPAAVDAARTDSPREAVPISEPPHRRLVSLDVFRGVTIAGMLLVNNPGTWSAIYAPLEHATWHGWTPTDLIFPFFLFIVGVAMVYSFASRTKRGATRADLMLKVLKRSAILFALGLLLHGFPDYELSTIRIPGVLQRIALAYLVASPIVLWTGWRAQAVIGAVLLLGYWALLTLVPVPGGQAGVLEPGRDLGAWIDRAVFGTEHLWIYSRTWDPEGLLSTLPAVATVLTGVLTGTWIRHGRDDEKGMLLGLFLAANAALVVGLAWGAVFPINKSLWTSSYVVFTTGMALSFLAVCYWLVDLRGSRRWSTPFVVFGTNAIAAFFLSSLFARILNLVTVEGPAGEPVALKTWIFDTVFASWLRPVDASLAFALCYVALWCALLSVLHRRGVFIKV